MINFCSGYIHFHAFLTEEHLKDYRVQLALSKDNLIKVAVGLTSAGIEVKDGLFGNNTIRKDSLYYDVNGGKRYKYLLDAVKSIFEAKTNFKTGKMYRFVYSGGTRYGEKRAVVVDEVHPDHILCRDLDTDNIKNYLFTKISQVQEI